MYTTVAECLIRFWMLTPEQASRSLIDPAVYQGSMTGSNNCSLYHIFGLPKYLSRYMNGRLKATTNARLTLCLEGSSSPLTKGCFLLDVITAMKLPF